jgi:serine/threonine protein kinase
MEEKIRIRQKGGHSMPVLEAGQKFERYRVIRWLGSGVSGESYEAEDTMLLRKVALKLIHPWSILPDASRRQFFREMQSISLLNAPYLAAVLDYGEIDGRLYLARRYVTSGSLLGNDGRSWFRPPLQLADAFQYCHQLAQTLEYIHNHNCLHGGLTFSNILVLRGANLDNEPDHAPFLLADVGLTNFARRFGEPQISFLPITAAPEQLGKRATPASDQFALAVLLYFWLTGRPPYLGTPQEIEQLKFTATITPPSTLNPMVTTEQAGVVLRALSVYPDERYPSVLAFAEALLATLQASPVPQTTEIQDISQQPEPGTPQPKILPEPTPQTVPDVPQPLPEPDVPEPLPEPEPQHAPRPQPETPQPTPDPIPQPAPDIPQPLPQPETPQTLPETPSPLEPQAEEALPTTQELLSDIQGVQPSLSPRLIITSPYEDEPYEVLLEREETTLGRAGSSDILLDKDNLTSRHHALLRRENDAYVLYDRSSANGVFVNGQKLVAETGYVLEDGDHISIGNYELTFRLCVSKDVDGDVNEGSSLASIYASW